MSKWDKYEVQAPQLARTSAANRWDKYEVKQNALPASSASSFAPSEDSYLGVIGKSFNKGAASLLDLPQNALSLTESILNGPANLYSSITGAKQPYNFDYYSKLKPLSTSAQETANSLGYSGLDEPVIGKKSLGKKLISGAAAGAGSLVGGGLLGKGLASAGAIRAGNFLGNPLSGKELKNLSYSGAGFGAASKGLEEAGVNPIIADVAVPLVASPVLSGVKGSLLGKFSKNARSHARAEEVKQAFKAQIGDEEAMEKILANIDSYQKTPSPIDLKLTTPEVAGDVGLSRFYQTQGANSAKLYQRQVENNDKIRNALHDFGTLGLDESTRGAAIRAPFVDEFEALTKNRSVNAKKNYDQLKAVKEGIRPENALEFIKEQSALAGREQQKKYDQYAKFLEGSALSGAELNKFKALSGEVQGINNTYKNLSEEALAQLTAPAKGEISELMKQKNLRPMQLEETVSELSDKINAAQIQGKNNEAFKYGQLKEQLIKDLEQVPEAKSARAQYAADSLPINDFEKTPLLSNFVKKNKRYDRPDGFVVADEKIPALVRNASLGDTKMLMGKIKNNPETLKLVKGNIIEDFARKIENAGDNLSPAKAKKFVYDKYDREKWREIFDQEELAKLDHIVDVLSKGAAVKSVGRTTANSNTFHQFMINNDINKNLGLAESIAKSVTKSLGGSKQQTLKEKIVNYVIEKTYGKFDQKFGAKTQKQLIEEALLDPENFQALINSSAPKSLFGNFKQSAKEKFAKNSKVIIPTINDNSR